MSMWTDAGERHEEIMRASIQRAESQRNELLAALERITRFVEHTEYGDAQYAADEVVKLARAAIKRATVPA